MGHLGEFGAAARELVGEKDEFGFFGETFTVVGSIPSVLMLQLGASATGKIDETDGLAAMWEALRCSLTTPKTTAEDGSEVEADPVQFNKFYKLAVENSCELDGIMRLVFALFEAQGGRPTQPVSASSPGQPPTSLSSSTSSTPAGSAFQPGPPVRIEHPALSHLRSVDELVRTG